MKYTAQNIRNIAILGHQSSGKTTLAEAIAYTSKMISTKGEIEKKNTICDYLELEKEKLSSVAASFLPVEYHGYKLNFIDLPGNDDFIGEVISVTRLIKGAILVIDAEKGIQAGTLKHFQMLKKRGIPTILFINKMDKENAHFEQLLQQIHEQLGKTAVPFSYPIGHVDHFDGFVNVVDLKARRYNGKECVDDVIYDDKKLKVFELHNMICEAVAQTSDELLEKFFSGETLSLQEIHQGLRQGVLNGELTPVLVGCATKNIGLHTLLDMCIDYMPNPSDLNPYKGKDENGKEWLRKTDENEPFSAYIFKTIVDPYAGVISVFKINSGSIKIGDEVYCPQTRKTEKISTLFTLTGKTQKNISEAFAGDIIATTKLTNVQNTMTLCHPKNVIIYPKINYPTAVLFKAITPKNKTDDDKLSSVLQKLTLEDPCLEVKRNTETKQLLLGGVGLSHLEAAIYKMKTVYKVEVTLQTPKIVYRESIKKAATAEGRYIKQSGGSGYYGVVQMRFEPAAENTFTEEVFGGAVPKNYFPAVEKGFDEACEKGLLAGFPVIRIKATLLDGKYHPVDSNELAFKMAAILAFKEAYFHCQPTLLEPIYRLTIHISNDFIGDVLSDINTRRAKVISMQETEYQNQEIVALVPEAEILEYANTLKALTQGFGYFNRVYENYEEVPAHLQDKIIQENKLL